MRTPSEAEIAYCAGLFEGEGHVAWYPYCGALIHIYMTDREPLEKFCDIMGGKIYGPYQKKRPKLNGEPTKPIWFYRAGTWDQVIRVANLMLPWLGPRRSAKIAEVLSHAPAPRRLLCAKEPTVSCRGYNRHLQMGTPACDNCQKNYSLYRAERRRIRIAALKGVPA